MVGTTLRERFLWVLKNTLNRVTVRLAGTRFGPFSLVRHVGRKSGKRYKTPVILAAVPEGFVAELTYGENVDWYRNIVAAGGCEVVHRGAAYRVYAVERCDAKSGRSAFPPLQRQILRVARRTDFRLLRATKV
ncbi:MAG: nitroreductase family deazaflavin-dependent oxidoreductase [Mycobacterium sp.]|nr:nitroreductase family deazaflavin-dependent oxidoreductase [Mycobacterium sp.]